MNTTFILFVVLIAIMYVFVYFLDRYLKIKSQSYVHFISKHNIQVQFMYMTLQTKTFNRMIYKISHINIPKRCHCFKYTFIYNLGVLFTLVSIPVSIYIIGHSIYSNLEKPQSSSLYNLNDDEEHYINVKPLVIGVNLPMSHLLYYIMSLLICIVIHELGHAVCALHENVRLNYLGVIIIFIVPIIYVDIENLTSPQVSISLLAKLRVYCAGIWHNILLTLLMYFILYTFPVTISPLYSVNEGVQVTHIGADSLLKTSAGKFGLEPFDVIYKINNCRVHNEMTYKQCLLKVNANKNTKIGYCLTDEFIEKHQETLKTNQPGEECCDANQTKHLCFVQTNATSTTSHTGDRIKRHVGNNAHREGNLDEIGSIKPFVQVRYYKDESQIQVVGQNDDVTDKPQNYCMQARLVLDSSKQSCVTSEHCSSSKCYSPHTAHSLIQIHVRHKTTYVLYLGRAVDMYNTLSVTQYVQKYTSSVFLSYLPTVAHNMAIYISILSSGLALVNAVPCYYFDSQHIVSVLVARPCLRLAIQSAATVLLVTYFLLFVPSTLFSKATR